jgi:hypothetical protein
MRTGLTALLAAGHLLMGVGWLGATGYSLFVLRPKAARFFAADDEAHETFVTTVAQGARWKVVGLLAGIGATGLALVALASPADRSAGWWVAVAAKAALLAIAAAIFWRVSWRYWPARVFALPAERPAWRRRTRDAGLALMTCAAAASLIGVAITPR